MILGVSLSIFSALGLTVPKCSQSVAPDGVHYLAAETSHVIGRYSHVF